MATAPAKKAGARAVSASKAKPVEHVDLPKPADLESPYPKGIRVFTYKPKDGSEPILLAMNGFDAPSKVWLFDLAAMPTLSQTWAWMRKANIPREIQRQAQLLPDAEYFEMFDKWFEAMKARTTSGE